MAFDQYETAPALENERRDSESTATVVEATMSERPPCNERRIIVGSTDVTRESIMANSSRAYQIGRSS
jgi:hypothetical protein